MTIPSTAWLSLVCCSVCSFVVLDYVRFISMPDWQNKKFGVTIDFSNLIALLKNRFPSWPTTILSLDRNIRPYG